MLGHGDWQAAALEERVRAFADEDDVPLGAIAQPLRAALTGSAASPGIFFVMEVLGRDESLGRIADAASAVRPLTMAFVSHLRTVCQAARRCLFSTAKYGTGPQALADRGAAMDGNNLVDRNDDADRQRNRQIGRAAGPGRDDRAAGHRHPQALRARPGTSPTIPAFMATAACRSSITYIDGDEGILMYRGYPIQELADKSDFLEVAYLLLNGELPTAKEKAQFVHDITHHTMVHEQLRRLLPRLPPRRASDGGHVRGGRGAVGLLSRFDRHPRPLSDGWSPPIA